jgi:hypothetical protein
MKVLIDGKEVECLNDVQIIYEDKVIDFCSPADDEFRYDGYCGDEVIGDIHITFNSEGMVTDTFRTGENDSYKTMCKDLELIIKETH